MKCVESVVIRMTEEEAKSEVDFLDYYLQNHSNDYSEESHMAMRMAYKALEQEEPCEDCISRQAVDVLVDELARAISDERCFISRGRSTASIMQDILDLPPVTPQPKVGHWIYTGDYLTEGMLKCSECGEEIDVSESYYGFCPNCGAKMIEVQESEVIK